MTGGRSVELNAILLLSNVLIDMVAKLIPTISPPVIDGG